jgi:hypothetical protein
LGTKVKQNKENNSSVFSAITNLTTTTTEVFQNQQNKSSELNQNNNNNNKSIEINQQNNEQSNEEQNKCDSTRFGTQENEQKAVDTFFSIKQISKISAYLNNEQSKQMKGQGTCLVVRNQ